MSESAEKPVAAVGSLAEKRRVALGSGALGAL